MIFRLNRYINVRAVAIAVMMMMTAALHVVAQSPAAGDTCRRNGVSSELSIAATPSLVLRPILSCVDITNWGSRCRHHSPGVCNMPCVLRRIRSTGVCILCMAGYRAWRHILFGLRSTWFAGGSVCAAGEPYRFGHTASGRRLRMEFRASFGWKHSSSTDAADRLLYGVGSSVNAYIGLAFMLSYEATPRLTLRFGPEIAHYSNGNTLTAKSWSQSCGITPVGHISSAWYQASQSLGRLERIPPGHVIRHHFVGRMAQMGLQPSVNEPYTGSGALEVPGRWLVGGLSFNPLYRFNPVVAAGAAVDLPV